MDRQSIEQRCRDIGENYREIRHAISEAALRSGRVPGDITFMAVTKTVDPVFINHAISLGVGLIGENKVQEFLSKREFLHLEGCRKHLIGHLQTNKVRQIVGQVDMIESVDSLHLAREIAKQSQKLGISTDILLEVNIGGEESKTGIAPASLMETAAEIAALSGVQVRGLMAIPPICDDEARARTFFSNMYKLFLDMRGKKLDNIHMDFLSMGMSGDYAAAVAEGSNLVRVGSALFGARIY